MKAGEQVAFTEYAVLTDRGLQRQQNQDSVLAYTSDSLGLYCIADGMGGYENGEQASKCIIQYLNSWTEKFEHTTRVGGFVSIMKELESCIDQANESIFHQYNNDATCGSTVSLLAVYEDCYGMINIGDSRIYKRHALSFRQVTVDDVWENDPDNIKGLNKEKLSLHPQYGKLSEAVGVKEQIFPNLLTGSVKSGDKFLICSDGIYKNVTMHQLKSACGLIRGKASMEKGAQQLKRAVYENGASDNLSVIIVEVK